MTEVSGGEAGFLYFEGAHKGGDRPVPTHAGIAWAYRGDLGASRKRNRIGKLEVGVVEGLSLVTPRIA